MKRASGSIAFKLAALCFALFCVFTVVRLQFKKNDIENDLRDASEKLELKEAEVAALNDELERPMDDKYIAEKAIELGYHNIDEKIFYSGN